MPILIIVRSSLHELVFFLSFHFRSHHLVRNDKKNRKWFQRRWWRRWEGLRWCAKAHNTNRTWCDYFLFRFTNLISANRISSTSLSASIRLQINEKRRAVFFSKSIHTQRQVTLNNCTKLAKPKIHSEYQVRIKCGSD